MTGDGSHDESCDEHDEDVPRRGLGEVPVDEPVTPMTDIHLAQEREATSESVTASVSEDCGCPDDRVSEELDELAEPATDLRTAQEKEAADDAGQEAEDG